MSEAPTLEPDVKGRWITFRHICRRAKTSVWSVLGGNEEWLGQIEWYGPWRKYAFYSGNTAVFEEVCLREIAEFIEARTKKHRLALKHKSKEQTP